MLNLTNATIKHLEFNKYLVTLDHGLEAVCEIGYDPEVHLEIMSFWTEGKNGEKYEHFMDIAVTEKEGKDFMQYKVDSLQVQKRKKNPVGRPSVENKRESFTVRLKPEIRAWLKEQNTGAGAIIEELVQEQMDRDNANVKR
jgi:hypothetical protein